MKYISCGYTPKRDKRKLKQQLKNHELQLFALNENSEFFSRSQLFLFYFCSLKIESESFKVVVCHRSALHYDFDLFAILFIYVCSSESF